MTRGEKAAELFSKGYNCAQAVVGAYKDVLGIDEDTLMKLTAPFGGGIAKQREVCGAVTGMTMVLGLLCADPGTDRSKRAEIYEATQQLCSIFREENGSVNCGELLGIKPVKGDFVPSERTAEYYKKRPCPELVGMAADILDSYLRGRDLLPK